MQGDVFIRADAYDRLVCFFYLLTRGTPGVDGMGWGSVKEVLREATKGDGENAYTSEAGEALAREIVHELLTGERRPVAWLRENGLAGDALADAARRTAPASKAFADECRRLREILEPNE